MTENKSIFLVTVIGKPGETGEHMRTWGWYSDFKHAEEAVLMNVTDLFESGYYNLAVIEEMWEGVMALTKNEYWYEASYSTGKIKIGKIKKPDIYKQVVHFSMG